MTERASALVTILFTDLVGSTELLSRTGDEGAQRIFRAHHDLLTDVASVHDGEEVKWLGDGLMVVFASAGDAVRAAVAMQQASRRTVEGEHLSIRAGLNAGEALRDAADWFGTPVVVARRLCDRAEGGQILCSALVAGLLSGHKAFSFSDLGRLALKGVPEPVAACEVQYEAFVSPEVAVRVPMVGREAEWPRLVGRLEEAAAGRGGLVLVAGEPGIGKTRIVEELAGQARRSGMAVFAGACVDSDWAPPYAPFAGALTDHVVTADPEALRVDLGPMAGAVAQLVPVVRQVLPGLPEPAPAQPDEERFRLFDSVGQFLLAYSARQPVVWSVDDLHWADRGTVAMLRHLARTAVDQRILMIGTYRTGELGAGHPLTDALGALPRETAFDEVHLGGLSPAAVARLLRELGGHEVPQATGVAWADETDGNPFFVRELLRHLVEEGAVSRGSDGRWNANRPLRELGIPKGVRAVLERRLARLSQPSRQLIDVACTFEGPFPFDLAASLAGLSEVEALDALDEALAAHIVRSVDGDSYTFAHALVRHVAYAGQSPSRRLRHHRRVAEALEAAPDERLPARSGEIAAHYHASRTLSGAERGVAPALAAADHAEEAAAYDAAARFLKVALDLLPDGDTRRCRLTARLGMALIWSLAFDEGVAVAREAGDTIARLEGEAVAAGYLSEAAYAANMAGSPSHAWPLARQGLGYAGPCDDVAWARLLSFDEERQAAEHPKHPGIPRDTAERRTAARILRAAHLDPMGPAPIEGVFDTGEEALTSSNLVVRLWAGDYRECLPRLEAEARQSESAGRLARAARCWSNAALCRTGFGDLGEASQAIERAETLAERLGTPIFNVLWAQYILETALDRDASWERLAAVYERLAASSLPALAWASGLINASAAKIAARLGRATDALRFLDRLTPWLEHAPAWTMALPMMACDGAETLWRLEGVHHLEVVSRCLRDKVVAAGFHHPMMDGRLALTRLCALQGRYDESQHWLEEARTSLAAQGALPLLAIADHDEALMLLRRGHSGDTDGARPLLESACTAFERLGMEGWLRDATELAVAPR